MRTICLWLVLCLLVSGCTIQSGVAPAERVIDNPSEKDFGFVGRWQTVVAIPTQRQPISITRSDETSYSVSNLGEEYDAFSITFHAIDLSPKEPHAVVEVHISDSMGNSTRRLVYAAVKADELKVWPINARELGELLYERRAPAVIEHNLYSSTVRCDKELLLDTVKLHLNDLLGEVRRFRRVTE